MIASPLFTTPSFATDTARLAHCTGAGARVTNDLLPSTLARCRATKTDAEVACLLRANQVSGAAHMDIWRAARPGET